MDVATLVNLLLFVGAFGANLAAGDDSGSADAEKNRLYNSDDYSRTDRLGSGDDTVTADADNLAWFMGGGDDELSGSSAADYADLGTGDDQARMGAGNDIVLAGDGNDNLDGNNGNDLLRGEAGEDNIFGDLGDDSLGGDAGNDSLAGGSGADILSGGLGDDLLSGFSLSGGAGAGMGAPDGADQLFGGAGDDRLILGRGDSATGGTGADRFEMDARWRDGTGVMVITDFRAAEDSLLLMHAQTLAPDTSLSMAPTLAVQTTADGLSSRILLNGSLVAVVEGVPDLDPALITLQADASVDPGYLADDFDTALPGTDQADSATGGEGDDYGRFGAGADTLAGEAGNDTLSGGLGADARSGGAGDDRLRGEMGDNLLTGDEGTDRLFGGAGADTLSGHDADGAGGTATAIDGTDRLEGGAGEDLLILGKGDLGLGGAGTDTFRLDATTNADVANFAPVEDYQRGTDQIEVQYTPVFNASGVEVPPVLTVIMGPNNTYAVIQLDGEPLAHVTGATTLTAADIRLVRDA
ncbi:MAG: calcium-binding protein [Alphaproteobacteria bacterium]|nr:calcium-binding protein [Alphaproteobacteria bacterium]